MYKSFIGKMKKCILANSKKIISVKQHWKLGVFNEKLSYVKKILVKLFYI